MPSARPTGYRPNPNPMRKTHEVSEGDQHPPSVDEHVAFVSPANDLLTVIGRDGCFKRVAPLFPPAFGYTEEELLDRPFLSFIHPADTAATSAALEKLAQGEPTLGLQNRFCCKGL
jgi:PAS domain S-box-containing protein